MGMKKICSKCGVKKTIDNFGFSRPRVRRGECKKCQAIYTRKYRKKNKSKAKQWAFNRVERSKIYRAENKERRYTYQKEWVKKNPEKIRGQKYRHNYGIDIEDYNTILKKQKYRCAICGTKKLNRKNAKFFAVDHCHETGIVRGLLCYSCNTLMGKAKDNIDIFLAAIKYLYRFVSL